MPAFPVQSGTPLKENILGISRLGWRALRLPHAFTLLINPGQTNLRGIWGSISGHLTLLHETSFETSQWSLGGKMDS